MNGYDKESAAHHEGVAKPKRTFGQKASRHCRRFWWVHLIVVIVIVLVVTLPLIYVAYPNIAQSGINDASLVVLSEKVLNPAPDSFDLELNTAFITNSKYHPQLYAFNGSLSLEGHDKPFISFEVPAIKASNGTVSHVKHRVQITDMDEFVQYTTASLNENEYTVVLTGKGDLKQGGLPKTSVNYNQKSQLTGFGGLDGIHITKMELLKNGYADGTNALATAELFNPTVLTLELGNVSISMFGPAPNHYPLGDSVIVNATLAPGNNTLSIRTIANQTSIANIVVKDKRYGCGVFPATLVGRNATYNGQYLPYYSRALQSQNASTQLNVSQTLVDAGFGFILSNCTT